MRRGWERAGRSRCRPTGSGRSSGIRSDIRLVLLPTGAGEPRALPAGDFVRIRVATFFPDGRRILFVGEDKSGAPRPYVQDLEGGPPKPVGDEGLWATLVSPDGRRIAGTMPDGVHWIYYAEGERRPQRIEGILPDDTLIQWGSDGKTIYVRGPEEQPLTLYRIDLATGRRERWKELTPPDPTGFQGYTSGPTMVRVTPDGRFYAYTFLTDSSRLVLAEGSPDWWR